MSIGEKKQDPAAAGPIRGDDRIRTGDKGFADLCLTTWRRRQKKNEQAKACYSG